MRLVPHLRNLLRRQATPASDPYILAVQMQEAQEAMVEQVVARAVAPLVERIGALEHAVAEQARVEAARAV